jgi:GT2 family glycosyltransferase
MFMLFSAAAFRRVGGFDERYFLYYEDVDICDRLQRMNFSVMACPRSRVIHNAQRASHRNWRHLRWHLGSMWRYLVLSRTRRNSQA